MLPDLPGTGRVRQTPFVRYRLALATLAACALAVPAANAAPSDSTTTVILVRHAEKDTLVIGADPPLNTAGMVRSQELARVLRNAGVSAFYSTPWRRNKQTAQPLASRQGDTLIVVDAIDETVRRLRTRHPGETVLVVGHSNTVPQIVEALCGEKIPPFTEGDYDRLYVITLAPGRPPSLLRLHYGAPGKSL